MAYKERIPINESKLAFVASDKNLKYKQPVMLKESELLLRGSEKYYKEGRSLIKISAFCAFLGFLCIVFLVLDIPLNNGEPILDFDQTYSYALVIIAAVMDIIAGIIGCIGRKRVYQAYAAIYRRSEAYRYAPHIL